MQSATPNTSLPCFEMQVDDTADAGLLGVSLVDNPAIAVKWKVFSQVGKPQPMLRFHGHGDQQMLYGPLMIPGQKIYRKEGRDEYNIVASRETIRQVAHRFMQRSAQHNLTHMHKRFVHGATVVELWLTEHPIQDKAAAMGFQGLPPGTMMLGVKVHDKGYWDRQVKSGKVQGFSLEGFFNMVPVKMRANNNPMRLNLSRFLAPKKAKAAVKLAAMTVPATAEDGSEVLLLLGDDGSVMMTPAGGGEISPAPDGAYETADGVLSVAAGVLAEAEETTELSAETLVEMATADGGKISVPQGWSGGEVFGADGVKLGSFEFKPEPKAAKTNPAEGTEPVATPTEVAALRAQLAAQGKQIQQLNAAVAKAGLKPVDTGRPTGNVRATTEKPKTASAPDTAAIAMYRQALNGQSPKPAKA